MTSSTIIKDRFNQDNLEGSKLLVEYMNIELWFEFLRKSRVKSILHFKGDKNYKVMILGKTYSVIFKNKLIYKLTLIELPDFPTNIELFQSHMEVYFLSISSILNHIMDNDKSRIRISKNNHQILENIEVNSSIIQKVMNQLSTQ